jgi:hypothetical protein
MDVDVPRDVASVDDAGPFGISSWQNPGRDATGESRLTKQITHDLGMFGPDVRQLPPPFPEPGAPQHSMLGDDAAFVQEGVAAHETRATGGSWASRRGAGSAGARTVGGACSSTTDCRSRAASTRCHCRPAPPPTRPISNRKADGAGRWPWAARQQVADERVRTRLQINSGRHVDVGPFSDGHRTRRQSPRRALSCTNASWGGRGSNPRPTDYESAALTN